MPLFELNNKNEINEVNEYEFALERELQVICENNLNKLLGLKLIKSEFKIESYRFDSLAYDEESKSFIIIEYKRGQNYSVIDQGYAYLSTMLNNKAEFILEYNECFETSLKRDEVDWSQSKVIFISQNFTKYQKDSISFKDLPIELYEIKRFKNSSILFNEIKGNRISSSITSLSLNNDLIKNVSKEVKTYTVEEAYAKSSEEIIELFEVFSEKIQEMISNIEIQPTKLYIAFKKNKKNVIDFLLQKNKLKMWLNIKSGELNDYKNIFTDVSNKGHWGNGDYEASISNDEELEYILSLIKEVYKKHNEII